MSEQQRLPFFTQQPRDDGCGLFSLQMLTGLPFRTLENMIDWTGRPTRYMTWDDLIVILRELGWRFTQPMPATDWREIRDLALVHVEPDHFMVYDEDARMFYDPAQQQGPSTHTEQVPMSFLSVQPPPSQKS
jgi:hypothetical protein